MTSLDALAHHLPVRLGAVLGAVLVFLAACSGGGADGPTASAAATAPAPAALGPLEELLVVTTELPSPQQWVAEMTARENFIAQCMADQGFDHYPAVPALADVTVTEGLMRGTREFVELHGYGIWNPPRNEGGGLAAEYQADPESLAYLEQMSEAEREAYETALRGPIIEQTETSTMRGGGCADQAWTGIDPSGEEAYLADVQQEAWDFLAYLPTSSAFDELNAEWSTCMRDSGLVEESPFAAEQRISAESAEAWGEGGQPNAELVAEKAADELAVAVADLGCREELDYDARHLVVAHELQAEYVRENQADLDAVAAAADRVRPAAGPTS